MFSLGQPSIPTARVLSGKYVIGRLPRHDDVLRGAPAASASFPLSPGWKMEFLSLTLHIPLPTLRVLRGAPTFSLDEIFNTRDLAILYRRDEVC
jgi:hypothetical protein